MTTFQSTLSRFLQTTCLALSISVPVFSHAAINKNTYVVQPSLENYLAKERNAAGLRSKTIKIDDITWSYSESGSSNKPAVLLLHGLAGNRDNWNGVAHFLTPYYHVIIPDLPSNGETKVADIFDLSVPKGAERLRRFV